MNTEGAQQHRRAAPRLRVGIRAKLTTLHGEINAQLLDLSQTGARIGPAAATAARGDAVLQWLSFEAFGEIIWRSKDALGIRFDPPLAMDVVKATRALAPSVGDQGEAREAAREWSTGASGTR